MKSRPSKLDEHAALLTELFDREPPATLAEAQAELEKRGCKVSLGGLSAWWSKVLDGRRQDLMLQRIAGSREWDEKIDAALRDNPAPELAQLIALLRILVKKTMIEGQTDPEMLDRVPALLKQVLEAKKREQDEARLAFDIHRWQVETLDLLLKHLEDERIKAIAAGPGTNQDKIALMGPAVFGDLWKVDIK